MDRLEPAFWRLGLDGVVVEWVLRPKIFLPETHDVVLLKPPIPVEGFVFRNDILICACGDCANDTATYIWVRL